MLYTMFYITPYVYFFLSLTFFLPRAFSTPSTLPVFDAETHSVKEVVYEMELC